MKREVHKRKAQLEQVLRDFKISGKVTNVYTGPVVTMFEFEPAPGTKSSRIINLVDDIARSMSSIACRASVVPGRNVIGIELPNTTRELVPLNEILTSKDFTEGKAKLPIALGKDINGHVVVVDIAKMPHVLVAGTTGSGKSVAINTFVVSLLTRFTPAECRLLMIDPKMLELSVYNDIPHLLTPVVTKPEKAVEALQWAVREMEDRYSRMAAANVRNIEGFNQSGRKMSYIVIIIDEVADLMMVAGKEVEFVVQRLAQMARAAGIHLIMATQRPSVDVITGTIKANFPTRISFQVASKFDSRTILGEQGAEQLLGMGDMLYMSGGGRIKRVHGAFVPDADVIKMVEALKQTGKPEYVDVVAPDYIEEPEPEEQDEYAVAVEIVTTEGNTSPAYLQRKLGTFYDRAVEHIDRMKREGIVA